jgi:hypothetical protein
MGDGFLDGFRREMQQGAALVGKEVADRLGRHLAADGERLNAPIADLYRWDASVVMELKTGAMWTVECLGANAYHVYPAFIREDGDVVWPNIWVAPDMTLDETVAQIRKEVFGKQE